VKYFALILLFICEFSEACRHRRPPDVENEYKKADYVFIAKVLSNEKSKSGSITVGTGPQQITVEDVETIKGETPPTTFSLLGCGIGSRIGEVSLFYLQKHNGKWNAQGVLMSIYPEMVTKAKSMATNKPLKQDK